MSNSSRSTVATFVCSDAMMLSAGGAGFVGGGLFFSQISGVFAYAVAGSAIYLASACSCVLFANKFLYKCGQLNLLVITFTRSSIFGLSTGNSLQWEFAKTMKLFTINSKFSLLVIANNFYTN